MSRPSIQQLSPLLVNRIAAGEVIERPAAVVKELVENAIDAGARHITIEVEDGGRALVRVIDDGCGIPPTELALAFASHATSKLTCDDDLFRIATMGFRGEALASIGSVSHARICSRTADSEAAYEIFNRGGVITDPQAAAGNVGTTIEVRNLFFNVPARRKFIKGAPTEFGQISETVTRLAIPHPHITFRLSHNGRTTFDLSATDEEARWLAAWPNEFAEQRLPLENRDAEIQIRGLIGLPELARPTAKYQFIYLNGRSIRDRFIQHALREAFRGLTEPGRYPAAVLLLEIPPSDVDVNVHPTKSEVRFRDGGRIHGLVHASIRERLLGSDLSPRAVANHSPAPQTPVELREKLASFFKQLPPGYSVAGPGEAATGGRPVSLLGNGPDDSLESHLLSNTLLPPAPSPTPRFDFTVGIASPVPNVDSPYSAAPLAPAATYPPSGEHAVTGDVATTDRPSAGNSPAANESPTARDARSHSAAALRPGSAMQLHNAYLVAQSDDGLVIVDQHALHERIMYEELLARLSRGPLESQRLLLPITISVATTQIALLESIQPLLQRLGIEVAPFGPGAVAVQAFPSFLEKLDPADFVRELLERGEQELLDLHDEELLHEVLDMMACKAAVKAGDPLTQGEVESLLARRELVERSSNCPHGRPTTLRFTLNDLEKQFKRTGF